MGGPIQAYAAMNTFNCDGGSTVPRASDDAGAQNADQCLDEVKYQEPELHPLRRQAVVIGPRYSSTSTVVAPLAQAFDTPMISPRATSGRLSDKEKFPYFARVVTPDTHTGLHLAALVNHLGWRQVSILSADEEYGRNLGHDIADACTQLNMSIASNAAFRETSSSTPEDDCERFRPHFEAIKRAGSKIIFLAAIRPSVEQVLRAASKQGLGPDNNFVWVGADGWYNTLSTSMDVADLARGGLFAMHAVATERADGGCGELGSGSGAGTPGTCFEQMRDSLRQELWRDHALPCAVRKHMALIDQATKRTISPWAAHSWDATFTAALAIDAAIKRGVDVMRYGSVVRDLIHNETDFVGATGRVQLESETGDRVAGYSILNVRAEALPENRTCWTAGPSQCTNRFVSVLATRSVPYRSNNSQSSTPVVRFDFEARNISVEIEVSATHDIIYPDGTGNAPPDSSASGDNASSSSSSDRHALEAVAGVLAVLLVGILGHVALQRRRRRRKRLLATDFQQLLSQLCDRGEIENSLVNLVKVPRELKRGHVTLDRKLGSGNFGEVWRGELDESTSGGFPAFPVAIKKAHEGDDAERDLMTEAAVMAQVDAHINLESLVGVVTSGQPKLLLLSLCEHGSLLGALQARQCGEGPLTYQRGATAIKLDVDLASDVACGMEQLAKCHFVHRDLAARNVLLDSKLTAKVADFGLSRGTSNGGDTGGGRGGSGGGPSELYYRSVKGIFPLRWTAPEAMDTLRFTIATDVWSFGVVMLEIYEDGALPYAELTNSQIVGKVRSGHRAAQPGTCPDDVYAIMQSCWEADPARRPSFADIVQSLDAVDVNLTELRGLWSRARRRSLKQSRRRESESSVQAVDYVAVTDVAHEPTVYASTVDEAGTGAGTMSIASVGGPAEGVQRAGHADKLYDGASSQRIVSYI